MSSFKEFRSTDYGLRYAVALKLLRDGKVEEARELLISASRREIGLDEERKERRDPAGVDALEEALDAFGPLIDADTLEPTQELVGEETPKKIAKRVLEAIDEPEGMRPVPISFFKDAPLPEKVIWAEGRGGAVLSEGEVTFLSGQGGEGKSHLALAVAWSSASPHSEGVCGLGVRSGKVVLLSYEGGGARAYRQLGMVSGRWEHPRPYKPRQTPEGVMIVPRPRPLWVAGEYGKVSVPSESWDAQWSMIQSARPSLVIIDPLAAAAPGIAGIDNTGAREFVLALMREAEEGGFGIVVVAHSNKMARFNTADPGPGCIAGPSQFYDSARGVLYCFRQGKQLMMVCTKANNGPDKWGVLMDADMREPNDPRFRKRFAGWTKNKLLDREGVKEQLKGGKK